MPEKIKPKQPFKLPAEFYNELIEVAEWAKWQQAEETSRDPSQRPSRFANRVKVKNTSGADRDTLDVLTVADSQLLYSDDAEYFKRNVLLTGAAVSSTLTLPLVVCAEPIPNNDYGWAYCSGIFPARINVNDAGHTYAGLKASDSTQLDSSFAANARIIYKESGTGASKLAVIQYPVVPVGVTTSPTTLGSSSEGSETADTTSWTRSSSGAPLDIWMESRTVYDHASGKTLYGFARKFSYDSLGLLIAVSGETRYTIDVAESC